MLKKPSLNKRRSKRLMKKLHIGPFQEMGMDLSIKYKEGVTTEQKDKFFDLFIEHCIEANNMLLGGSWYDSFVTLEKGSADMTHVRIIEDFISKHYEIVSTTHIKLVDVWYGPFPE